MKEIETGCGDLVVYCIINKYLNYTVARTIARR